jgi:phosphohistidine phosphatase
MTDLYLVRHAIAEDRDPARWPDDSLRPLTDAGIERFRRAARGLRTVVPAVERVLSSPFTRAWHTAELLREEADWPEPEPAVELAAGKDPAEAQALVGGQRDVASVALVGHEPHLSSLASLLATGDASALRIELKKGGVIALASDAATTDVRWVVTPKILRGLCSPS